jgi:hypothetical protein
MSTTIALPPTTARPPTAEIPPAGPAREAALDLTRACLTLLVIAHHAVLAYHRYAPPPGAFGRADLAWGAFPVVDANRAPAVDGLTLWNDSFFMAMMFLLSGLFVAPSLARKGAGRFLRDRAVRLGFPFLLSAAVLAPLAYWPAYLQRTTATSAPGFVEAWLALGIWPAGPAWFLWVLLAFSAAMAALQVAAPRLRTAFTRWGAWCGAQPLRACLVLGIAATLVYLGTTRLVSPFVWSTWGPFTWQPSRAPLYALYFTFGYALGAAQPAIGGRWMTPEGPLARRWTWWHAGAGLVFVEFVAALITWLISSGKGPTSPLLDALVNILFAVTGVVTTFAVLATFARWGQRRHPLFASLSRNAFGMYLVHYPIVTWTQFSLLGVDLPGLAKAALVTATAIGASWGVSTLLRRIPGVSRVL